MEAHVPQQPLHIDRIRRADLGVDWSGFTSADQWLREQPVDEWKRSFQHNGYLKVDKIVSDEEVAIYRDVCARMMSGEIDTGAHRHDLGNHTVRVVSGEENICQIMWPCLYVKGIVGGPLHQRTRALAQLLLGRDVDIDFDMIIAKMAHTDTVTPWHQDASYWPKFADTRACSIWVSLDEATVDNGCMWFVPGSHQKPLRSHWRVGGKHVQQCDCSESEGLAVPLHPGGATVHDGFMLHYTRGNSTPSPRRAYIVAYRPAEMIQWSREMGIDHGKQGLDTLFGKDDEIDDMQQTLG